MDPTGTGDPHSGRDRPPSSALAAVKPYFGTFLLVAAVTITGRLISPFFPITNIAFLYLLPVLWSAVRSGRWPFLFASLLAVLTFDFFFMPPVLTFAAGDVRHVFTFAVVLFVGVVTGTMATRIHDALQRAGQREQRMLALYALSRQIASKADLAEILEVFVKKAAEALDSRVSILMAEGDDGRTVREVAAQPPERGAYDDKEIAVVQWVLQHGQSAGRGTETLRDASRFIFPVKADDMTLAALVISPEPGEKTFPPEGRQVVEAFASLAAVAIIRLRLAREAEETRRLAESEKLHRAVLDSVSHDLRTPLASITGAVTSLLGKGAAYDEKTTGILLDTIREGALRMNRFVGNLLDMARLESGSLKLNSEWCDVQDIVGVALREMRDTLGEHAVSVDIPPGLPLVKADFALIEHVMINLLENAAKYAPPKSRITLSAHARDKTLLVAFGDEGPPVPSSERGRIFDKFHRLRQSGGASGTGLGLSICKGIIEAHGGAIGVEASPQGGNRFFFSLPLPAQDQPEMFEEGADHAV
jgi:two-component system sensor histidine kinase KdpD